MISALTLQNFQAHKDTTLTFDPHITAIVGSSDSGKTSILRALYWALQNKPSGTQMVSFWNRKKDGSPKGTTSVSLTVEDHTIARVRSADRNGYDWDNQELSAIGRDVPEQITSYLNLSDINIARQFDQHFLLSETSGDVARRLNELVHLDIIDQTLSQAEKDKRAAKKEATDAEAAISLQQKQLDALDWTDKAEGLIQELGEVEKTAEKGQEALRKLSNARLELQTYADTLNVIKRIVEAGRGPIDEIATRFTESSKCKEDIDKLLSIKRRISEAEVETIAFGLMRPAKRVLEFIEESMAEAVRIENEIDNFRTLKEALIKVDSDINELYIEMETAKKELPKTCPTCGAALEECSESLS